MIDRRNLLQLAGYTSLIGATVGPAAAATPTSLRIRLNADLRSTNPGVNRDENSDAVVLHMVEGLVAYRADTSVGPLLASSYDISDDGKNYIFHLRPDVKFHNGVTMTAEHVVWTWKRYLDPKTKWRGYVDFTKGINKILDVKAVDQATVIFTLEQPSSLFLVNMARMDCGGSGILHPDSVDASGAWIKPIGTGPFMLGQWRKDQSIELLKFAHYSSLPGTPDGYTGGKAALVNSLIFTVIPDDSAADISLQSGAIDVIWPLSPTDYMQIKGKQGLKFVKHAVLDLYALLFQTKDPVLSDPRIRRAIAMSIDDEMLTQGATQGICQANQSPIPAESLYYTNVQKKGYPYDISAAKVLLKQAGYRGQPITIQTNKHYMPMYNAAVLIQAMLQQAGIAANIEVLDWASQLSNYLSGNYQAMSFGYSARLDPALTFDSFMGNKSVEPRKIWDNPKAQSLLTESMMVQDRQKRQAIFDQLTTLFWQQMPMVALFNGTEITGLRKDVKGYQGWAAGDARFWNVEIS